MDRSTDPPAALGRLWTWIKENVHGNGFACAHGYCEACKAQHRKRAART